MRVFCTNNDCIHEKCGECTKETITVSEIYDEGCEDFFHYFDTDEYNNCYYKAVKTKDGKQAKTKVYRGKRIEYNEYVFYTDARVIDDKDFCVTEARTGFGVGNFDKLKTPSIWKLFVEREKGIPNVETLPLAEWNNGGYEIVEKGGSEE